ncbi:unnamed protein product [Gongylonema pulchrum]|uniref:Protein kinase domain-containing protein n=1 Tax=Gongylonema pulchrum TaxID=637853 RepID=A0A183EAM2_9BILA|nr:unnamed protein product [Gongylonema pulchrum]
MAYIDPRAVSANCRHAAQDGAIWDSCSWHSHWLKALLALYAVLTALLAAPATTERARTSGDGVYDSEQSCCLLSKCRQQQCRFKIIRRLGSGSFGKVSLAYDRETNRQVSSWISSNVYQTVNIT